MQSGKKNPQKNTLLTHQRLSSLWKTTRCEFKPKTHFLQIFENGKSNIDKRLSAYISHETRGERLPFREHLLRLSRQQNTKPKQPGNFVAQPGCTNHTGKYALQKPWFPPDQLHVTPTFLSLSLSLSLSSQSSPWRHRKPTRNILKAEPRTPRTQQLRVRMGDGGDVNNSRERQKTWTEPPVSRWKHLPFTLPDKAPLFIIPLGSTFGSFPNNFSSFL